MILILVNHLLLLLLFFFIIFFIFFYFFYIFFIFIFIYYFIYFFYFFLLFLLFYQKKKKGKCTTVFKDLYFANGLVVTDNGDALLVSETAMARITKLFVKGPRKGQKELFLVTPGYFPFLLFSIKFLIHFFFVK